MPRLTLRTLLAYIDDTLPPEQARSLGLKVANSDEAKLLIERIKRVTRRRGLRTPVPDGSDDDVADPNTVAAYLSDNLDSEQLKQIESTCLGSDVHLAEVAACHQILTLVLTEPVRVPPTAHQRMYQLVPAPASNPDRKPGKTIPVGRVTPPPQADADDQDAALLLGMRRYSAADSWAGRLKLVAAVGGIGLFLVLAVLMALPPAPSQPPETSHGVSYASSTPTPSSIPTPSTPVVPVIPAATDPSTPAAKTGVPPTPVTPPMPKPPSTPELTPDPKPTTPPVPVAVPPKEGPGAGLGDKKIPAPQPERVAVGKMEGLKVVIVLAETANPEPRWRRLVANDPVMSTESVMALPGYKAEVKLVSEVVVRLWGNTPEQVSKPKARVLQSQVRFYSAPTGLDADFTLEEGRVYVNTTKPTGAKIRVRMATEAWDIELPNNLSEVLLQAHSAFVPGTAYPPDGVGGEPPRTDALMVVVRGGAKVKALGRFVEFANVQLGQGIEWDSKTNNLPPPGPINREEVAPDWNPAIPSEFGKVIQHTLSDTAEKLTDPPGIRTLLEERLNYARQPATDLPRQMATYAYAAIIDGLRETEEKKMVANMFDAVMNDTERVVVRQTAMMTASAWLARAPKNTAILVSVLKEKNIEEANLIAQLLRGYSAAEFGPTAWNASKVDELVNLLNNPSVIVREAALGNLIGYYDYPAALARKVTGEPPIVDVARKADNEKEYEKFVLAWQARADLIKKWMNGRSEEKAGKKP